MENHKKQVGGSSSSSTNFDHLFGPKGSTTSSPSSSSSSIFGSIFSHPSTVVGRDSKKYETGHRVGSVNVGPPPGLSSGRQNNKGENTSNREGGSIYQNETVEPCYFSSSIYYGGQENYSPRTNTTHDSQHIFKKDTEEDDPNGNGSNSASRGNWWQGSLYY